ncbi:TetR/AcrR family transcriptional regulator [Cellulomonas fimi]|uniref:Regulatory protein TetR n=1 Tax=Cellulomonas fimi (strain ATCC 484 / DSM 20113 / JCM 1341 / CCUG 24087 / LMG 16345 / NBRC 15513 / NCIMB 8980 / NCTC 7547 / NRS-133) TaxID=590998 RepID=F4H4R7_CELFA|nr:TetR/AcrR family transcriptional regulator [Cellulomonas fimi]AEE44268.1 regulatory protein TetR [Cellulomonas fimi ATCC 484]NNH05715.1 TetR/AcrR family transcriptional regulator [Cellulomonas fimi]VEH26004.1 Bacterial regulatory proteins, tetR family [Cellulomonas fimi]
MAAVLRADARRNRDRIVAAATTLLLDVGPDVALETVARTAGVGIGTLYRRFADRDALVRAVVVDALGVVREDVRAAHGAGERPWDALVRVLAWSPHLRVVLRLVDAVPPAEAAALGSDPDVRALRDEIVGMVDDLVRAAQEEGTLRADVATGDVVLLVSAVSRALPPGAGAENAYARAHALVLDGLHTPAGHPLPGAPVRVDDLYA